ncbi:MAG: serine/threonine protein kinase [Planctomycetota bacterium]
MSGNQSSSPSSFETELGRICIERNLATQDEVSACQDEHRRRAAEGAEVTLGDVMVEKGVITQRQLDRVRRSVDEMRTSQQIPGYRIDSRLGAGAMATVFKAEQLSLNRLVAIKVLPKRFSENPEYVERFYKEGMAAAKLNHANIVQAIDVGEAGGYHYFVMEYVEGHTLWDELNGGKVFTEEEAVGVMLQIARALAHAHERGLIHRDVKPKNIMITNDGVAKLADMGLARMASDEQAARAEAGKAYGTPYYISPEQVRGERDIDFRADIYSLGATLYHLVTGRVPFEADTPSAVMHMHLREPLTPPDHINTSLSVGLGEVVEVMMAKDRGKRYASTDDLILDLEAIASGRPPVQARKSIGTEELSALAEHETSLAGETKELPAQGGWAPPMALVYALLAALVVSIVLNILLATK